MSAEGLDELEIKLDQLADVDLNKAVGNAIQTKRSRYECTCGYRGTQAEHLCRGGG